VSYLSQRFPPWPFFPLAGLLAAPGILSDARAGALGVESGSRIGVALVLLLALRLADDLADREWDLAQPRRRSTVMASEPSRAWRALQALALTALAGLALLPGGGVRIVGALALCAVLGGWYRWRPPPGSGSRFLNAVVVLGKYPAIVALLWPALGRGPGVGALALSYGGALGYELAHDPSTRPRGSGWSAFALGAALGLAAAGLVWSVA
tara:strand:+ start:135 stop:764 length:630 start_codon:yes stop_codon:yes gene_type:complete